MANVQFKEQANSIVVEQNTRSSPEIDAGLLTGRQDNLAQEEKDAGFKYIRKG